MQEAQGGPGLRRSVNDSQQGMCAQEESLDDLLNINLPDHNLLAPIKRAQGFANLSDAAYTALVSKHSEAFSPSAHTLVSIVFRQQALRFIDAIGDAYFDLFVVLNEHLFAQRFNAILSSGSNQRYDPIVVTDESGNSQASQGVLQRRNRYAAVLATVLYYNNNLEYLEPESLKESVKLMMTVSGAQIESLQQLNQPLIEPLEHHLQKQAGVTTLDVRGTLRMRVSWFFKYKSDVMNDNVSGVGWLAVAAAGLLLLGGASKRMRLF